jgi:hypothetical protein
MRAILLLTGVCKVCILIVGRMKRRLQFRKDGRVYWENTHIGTIEPLLSQDFKWGYLPTDDGFEVPHPLRKSLFHNTQREIKSRLRHKVRMIDRWSWN